MQPIGHIVYIVVLGILINNIISSYNIRNDLKEHYPTRCGEITGLIHDNRGARFNAIIIDIKKKVTLQYPVTALWFNFDNSAIARKKIAHLSQSKSFDCMVEYHTFTGYSVNEVDFSWDKRDNDMFIGIYAIITVIVALVYIVVLTDK